MLLRKIKNKISALPITLKVTLWYTVFILFLLAVIISTSLFVTNKLMKDLSEKELIKSVNEMATEDDEFESFDDGIFFSIYEKGTKTEGALPKGFNENLVFSDSELKDYIKGSEKYYYYDVKLKKGSDVFLRGVIPVNKIESGMKELSAVIVVFMPLLVIVIILGGYRIMKNAFRPVRTISQTALDIGRNKDFSRRIEIDEGKDEIHRMADAFNNMLDNLEESYNREKQFSSDVSHELKTPVSVILAESEYGLEYAGSAEEARESLEVVHRQSRRMSILINEILELSRLDRKETVNKENIDLSSMLRTVAEDYSILFRDRGIKVNCSIEDGISIAGEKIMIERVIDNLLSNALKFTSDYVEIILKRDSDKAVLEVADNGAGIDERNRKLIWNRFYQVNSSRNRDCNSGYGLGLSFVYKIAELHGGRVYLDSEPGKGSRFKIVFDCI